MVSARGGAGRQEVERGVSVFKKEGVPKKIPAPFDVI